LPLETIMHAKSLLLPLAVLLSGVAFAADKPADKSLDGYPLKACVVSDEPLGSMGDAVKYTHREAGKPDRLVLFCCEGCVDDFKAAPAKFLAKLDAAAKGKAAPKSGDKARHEHKK
jgi:hypothetical protein